MTEIVVQHPLFAKRMVLLTSHMYPKFWKIKLLCILSPLQCTLGGTCCRSMYKTIETKGVRCIFIKLGCHDEGIVPINFRGQGSLWINMANNLMNTKARDKIMVLIVSEFDTMRGRTLFNLKVSVMSKYEVARECYTLFIHYLNSWKKTCKSFENNWIMTVRNHDAAVLKYHRFMCIDYAIFMHAELMFGLDPSMISLNSRMTSCQRGCTFCAPINMMHY